MFVIQGWLRPVLVVGLLSFCHHFATILPHETGETERQHEPQTMKDLHKTEYVRQIATLQKELKP